MTLNMYICLSATAVCQKDRTEGIQCVCVWEYTSVTWCWWLGRQGSTETRNFSPHTCIERDGPPLISVQKYCHLHLSLTAAGFFSIRSAQVCFSSSSSSSCSTTAHNRSNKAGAQGEIMMHDRVGPFISVFYNGCRVEVIKLQHHYNERAPLIETRWGSGGLCRNCTSQLCHWGGGFN